MSEAVEIRDYAESDGEVCHRLRARAFLEAFSSCLSPAAVQAGANSYGIAEFSDRISAMKTLVATVDGIVVGFCTIRVESSDRAEVLYLYIDSGHRGEGVGSQLLRRAERLFLDSHPGIALLYLDTAVPDYNQAFWEHMGYQYVGSSTCDYPSGRIPAARLEKAVDDSVG